MRKYQTTVRLSHVETTLETLRDRLESNDEATEQPHRLISMQHSRSIPLPSLWIHRIVEKSVDP
jgi:hypothetical protein